MNWKNASLILISALAFAGNSHAAGKFDKGEWMVRFTLASQDGALEDSYNRLGQKNAAELGLDSLDLPELDQTWPGTYLSIIFYRPDWGTELDGYNTDFHPVALRKKDEWTFEVRSDDPYRDLTLSWKGRNTDMKKMVLVDLQENIVVAAVEDDEPQQYSFSMNGPVREFAWRLLRKKKHVKKLVKAQGTPEEPAVEAAAVQAKVVAVQAADAPAARSEPRKSNWLPKGWGQGEGKGYRRRVTAGLPDDPFAD